MEEAKPHLEGIALYSTYLGIVLCLGLAGMFAGLTLCVMGLDTISLEIISTGGKEPDRSDAAKLLPIRKYGNRLLCTLLLGNVLVNTALAQLIDSVVTGIVGNIISTVLLVILGEILPQSYAQSQSLKVGAASVPVVRLFLFLFYPVTAPIAWALDRFVGTDPGQIYDRNELRKLMAVHASSHFSAASGIVDQDLMMMLGAMDLHDKTALEAMTPLNEVFMVEATDILTDQLVHEIWSSGHSRVPVYRSTRSNVVGLLFAKDLLLMRTDERISVLDVVRFYPRQPLSLFADTKLIVVLQEFRTGKSHLGLVRQITQVGAGDPVYETVGVVTLEDVIEELIRANIEDEFDVRAEEESRRGTGGNGRGGGRGGRGAGAAASALELKWLGLPKDVLRGMRKTTLEESHARVASLFLVESVAPFAGNDPQRIRSAFVRRDHVYRIKAPLRARQLPLESKSNLWLYRRGIATNFMALVITGAVEIFMDDPLGDDRKTVTATASEPVQPLSTMFQGTTSRGGAGTAAAAGDEATAHRGNPTHHIGHGGVKLLPSSALPVMEMTQWTVLGASVLGAPGGTVVPDFSARVVGNSVLLLITSSQFKEAMHQLQHHHPQPAAPSRGHH